jgi:hypothetical protein
MAKAQTGRFLRIQMQFDAESKVHSATSPFVYDINHNRSGAKFQTLVNILTWYWISFVIYNVPNPLRAPKMLSAPFWPSYSDGGQDGIGFSALAVTYTNIEVEPDELNHVK